MSYLTHDELLRVLPELDVSTSLPDHPFSAEQVKVCSIDLRCDRMFWIQRRHSGAIDLASTALMETSPRRHWIRREVPPGQAIRLRPGEMILGRTYERFRVPVSLVGKITGRSSYARLGIEISCTCDLINPGWEGHVPLELVNNLKASVLVYPLLPLAQVFLMPLAGAPAADYADRERFQSKYMNDDGGPSYWWRDSLVKRLYQNYLSNRVDIAAVERLNKSIERLDDNGIFRLERFIKRSRLGEITNPDDVIDSFVNSEKSAKRTYQALQWLPRLFLTVLLPTSAAVVYYDGKLSLKHWLLFAATLISGLWAFGRWWMNRGDEPAFLTSLR